MKPRFTFYGATTIANAILFIFLFLQMQVTPQSFVEGFGLQPSLATTILCKRASMLFLGFAVLLILSCRVAEEAAKIRLSVAMAVTMLGFAAMGLLELSRGTVGSGVAMAAGIEIVFGLLYIYCIYRASNTIGQLASTDQT